MIRRFLQWVWRDEPLDPIEPVPDKFDDPHAAMQDLTKRVHHIQRQQNTQTMMFALAGIVLVVIAVAAWSKGGFQISIGVPSDAPYQSEAQNR